MSLYSFSVFLGHFLVNIFIKAPLQKRIGHFEAKVKLKLKEISTSGNAKLGNSDQQAYPAKNSLENLEKILKVIFKAEKH